MGEMPLEVVKAGQGCVDGHAMVPPPGETPVDEGVLPFRARIRRRVLDPTLLAGPVAAGALCLFRLHGLIAPLSYWLIVVLVVGAQVVSVVAAALWTEQANKWQLTVYVGLIMGVIGVIAYSTGWGPILSLGFIFGASYALQLSGSQAARPAMAWTVIYMVLGQLAIASGIAPSLIRRPLVHGLAGLGLLGVLLTIALLGRYTSARETVEGDLRKSESRFKALVRNASDIIIVTDRAGMAQYVSPAFERILGISSAQFAAHPASDFMHPSDLERMRVEVSEMNDDLHDPWQTELRLQEAGGSWRWFEATVTRRLDDPDVMGIVANLHDITERRRAEEALREAHERFRSAFENAPIGMGMADLEGKLVRANSAFGKIVGRSAEELCGMNLRDLTHPDDRETTAAEMRRLRTSDSEGYQIEKRYLHSDGHEVWVSASVSCVRDDNGTPLYFIGQSQDITERRAMHEHLAHAAIHDPLTALPNRVLFMDRLHTALNRSQRHGSHVAVIFMDLDRFKLVNDSMGHDGGDQVLRAVALRIQAAVRPSDTVARFGGDEFTILCEDVSDESMAMDLAGRIAASFDQPLEISGSELFVTASLGLALSSYSVEPERLLRDADTAMYRAKEQGRASIELFDERNDIWSIGRLRTGNDLHLALQRDELELHYQPFVDLATNTLVGVEALVRWQHPTRGLLLPAEFIDLAEDIGLIVPMGRWVLYEACRQAAGWRTLRGAAGKDIWRQNVSINVAPRQLASRDFTSQLAMVLDDTHMDPDGVWLEITESTLLQDPDQTITTLRALRDLGVHISIDDFGTGYSSLSYLQQLPVESLKIDQTFVEGLGRHSESSAIVKAVIGLAHSLGLACIAEGVETSTQAQAVTGLGCALAQGYLFGRPMAASQLGVFPADDLSSWDTSVTPTTA